MLGNIEPRAIALQVGFFAVLGGGVLALKALSRSAIHPLVEAHPEVCAHHGVAAALSMLGDLGDDAEMEGIVQDFKHIVHLASDVHTHGAQGQLARAQPAMVARVRGMCKRSQSVRAVVCMEEAVPQLEQHLEDMLHNHLLARRSTY